MTKESLFLGELEEIIDVMQPREFGKLQHIMFHQLARSIKSNHYQVSFKFFTNTVYFKAGYHKMRDIY